MMNYTTAASFVDDVTDSSIYDLDHAPEPSATAQHHHHNNSMLFHLMGQSISSSTTSTATSLAAAVVGGIPFAPPPPPPPPPPSSVGGGNHSSRYGRSASLSPRPPPTSGSGRSGGRKSIVVGENPLIGSVVHPSINLSQPSSSTTTTRDNVYHPTSLSNSFISTVFNRRRLSSHSSVLPQQYPLTAPATTSTASNVHNRLSPSSLQTTPPVTMKTTAGKANHSQRQRAYTTNVIPDNVDHNRQQLPHHHLRAQSLAHVRSFPPPSHQQKQQIHHHDGTMLVSGSIMSSLRDSPIKESDFSSRNTHHPIGDPENNRADDEEEVEIGTPTSNKSHQIFDPVKGVINENDDDEYEDQVFNDEDDDINSISVRYRADTGMSEVSNSSFDEQQKRQLDPTMDPTSAAVTTPPSQEFVHGSSTYTTPNATITAPPSNHDMEITQRLQFLKNHSGIISSPPAQQPISDANVVMHDEDEDDDDDMMQQHRVHLFGIIPLPLCFSKRRISWDRVSTFVATWAPCFVCFRMEYSTYRAVLFRLNILVVFMAIIQVASSTFMSVILYSSTVVDRDLQYVSEEEYQADSGTFEVFTNVWNLNGALLLLGIVASVVLLVLVTSIRAIQNVDLTSTIGYFWLTLWIIPLQTFWTVSMFDYFHVTDVWIKFWWRDRTMAWFRHQFCYPSDTANAECTVPRFADVENETEWCQTYFNSTNCTMIRDNAQLHTSYFFFYYYLGTAIWTIIFIIILFLVQQTLQSIITRPLVEKSHESNVPTWLLLPTGACTACGVLFAYSASSILNTQYNAASNLTWISTMFMVAGAQFLVLVLLAWFIRSYPILSTSRKHHKSIAIVLFLIMSLILSIALATIFVSCIIETIQFSKTPISDSIRGEVACSIDQTATCTLCDFDSDPTNPIPHEDQCPEWSQQDVTSIIQSQAQTGAAVAIIALFYATGSFRYGLVVQKHVFNYKIAYV